MSTQSSTRKFAVAFVALIGAAAFTPGLAHADSPRKALNLFGDMVDTMAGVAAAQEDARAAAAENEAKCWTEKRTTKSAGKTVIKTVKVCE
ncbi:hypothetical protein [Methylopila sp. M107]|uniref:hypothetical protein n=1 Tax=Methylopila sp. M107 TaxID=1101190 RepID=UPI00036D3AB8|nr:hypothetical protein [Methylopila sp. M107]